jgi:diketogulonate reductase-like aldo/keto reductase
MRQRRLGRTEHLSSAAVLGGAAFWRSSPSDAAGAIRRAVARGVNHIDIAPSYGVAEEVAGPVVAELRDRLFVAAKTMVRDVPGVRRQFDGSRRALGCEVLDLYQVHGVISLEELEGRAAALDEVMRLREQGATRFVGITGHDHGTAKAQLEALRRWDLDTVMLPVNPTLWANPGYREDAEELLAECARRDVGVHAIKAGAWRPWQAGPRWATTWYEPATEPALLRESLSFALSVPGVHVVCTPGDVGLLERVLDVLESSELLDEEGRRTAVRRAASGQTGAGEIFPRRHG